jgi:hypothetical protein
LRKITTKQSAKETDVVCSIENTHCATNIVRDIWLKINVQMRIRKYENEIKNRFNLVNFLELIFNNIIIFVCV